MEQSHTRQTPQTQPLSNRSLAWLEARALSGLPDDLTGRERPARRHYLRSVRSAPSVEGRKAVASTATVVEVEPEQRGESRGTTVDDDSGEEDDPDLDSAAVALCFAYVLGMQSDGCTRVAHGQREDCSEACKAKRKRGQRARRDAEHRHREVVDRNIADTAWLEERARFAVVDDLIRSNRGLVGEALFDQPAEDVHGNVLQQGRITDAPVARPYGLEEKLQRGHIDGSLLDLRLAKRDDYITRCVSTQRRLRREFYERAAQRAVVRLQDRGDRHQLALDFAVAA